MCVTYSAHIRYMRACLNEESKQMPALFGISLHIKIPVGIEKQNQRSQMYEAEEQKPKLLSWYSLNCFR